MTNQKQSDEATFDRKSDGSVVIDMSAPGCEYIIETPKGRVLLRSESETMFSVRTDELSDTRETISWPDADVGQASGLSRAGVVALLLAAPVIPPLECSETSISVLEDRGVNLQFLVPASQVLTLSPQQAGTEISVRSSQPVELTPLAKIQEPPEFREWITSLDEPWLSQKIGDCLEYDDTWNTCVAVGLLARMGPMSEFTVDAVLRGETPNGKSRRWAQTLDKNELDTIEDLAFSELEGLHQGLEALDSTIGYKIDDWQDDWVALCHGRDDLEGIRLILSEGRSGERFDRALKALDEDCMRVVLSLPRDDLQIDDRMSRVGTLEPTAWWSGDPAWELLGNRDATV